MITIAVTGHTNLNASTQIRVKDAMKALLANYADQGLIGVSCLAKGADTIFADTVLEMGGKLLAIIPSQDYRATRVKPDHAEDFDRLIAAADDVVIMDHVSASRIAYDTANKAMLKRADRFIAVWDSSPPSGKGGGTADTVLEAQALGISVDIIWPEGAERV